MTTKWTSEEDQIIRDNIETKNYLQMTELLPNWNREQIKHRTYQIGLKSKLLSSYKYDKDDNFFSNPNLLSSYIAGELSADGCLALGPEKSKSYTVRWRLSSKDLIILENIKKATKFVGPIKIKEELCQFNNKMQSVCSLSIGAAQQWYKDLEYFYGIIPNKTYRLAPPKIHDINLLKAFLIGYTDGDGCIHIRKDNCLAYSFSSASLKILEWIKDFTDKEYSYNSQRSKKIITCENYYKYSIQGMQAAMIIDDLRKIDVPKLSRKWEMDGLIELINKYRDKRPELFIRLN